MYISHHFHECMRNASNTILFAHTSPPRKRSRPRDMASPAADPGSKLGGKTYV